MAFIVKPEVLILTAVDCWCYHKYVSLLHFILFTDFKLRNMDISMLMLSATFLSLWVRISVRKEKKSHWRISTKCCNAPNKYFTTEHECEVYLCVKKRRYFHSSQWQMPFSNVCLRLIMDHVYNVGRCLFHTCNFFHNLWSSGLGIDLQSNRYWPKCNAVRMFICSELCCIFSCV